MPKYLTAVHSAAYSTRIDWSPDVKSVPARRPLTYEKPHRLEFEQAKRDLESIAKLEDDWDGYGGEAPNSKVRLNAWHGLTTAKRYGLVPDITPRANGTISLEWDVEGVFAHLQVGAETCSMYVRRPGRATVYFAGSVAETVGSAIDRLASMTHEALQSDSLLAVRM